MRRVGISDEAWLASAEEGRSEGQTVMFVAIDGTPAGLLAVADPIKPTTPAAIRGAPRARHPHRHVDWRQPATAEAVARQLGIDEVEANVSPEEKNRKIVALKGEGRTVAMAGDGINDAPALAAADVGIAMGTGTDVAIESAGVTLVRGDLLGVVQAIALVARDDAQHPAEPVLRLRYNTLGDSDRRRRAVPALRVAAQPDDRCRGDEL